ncbi:hypothetical protein [Leisingera sp. JC11]|uniref:hypothetical protein n=1 Tax=Leisingera sp. JC11 TaxID=3042469 RepID=UPI0034527EF4
MFTADFSVGDLDPALKSLFFLWKSASGADAFPRLSKLGLPYPATMPNILSVFEIERTQAGEACDFKALYVRNKIINTLSSKFAGTRLTEHPGFGPGSMMWSCFAELAANPRPLLISLPYVGPLPEYRSTTEVYLPLRGEGTTADYVLVGVVLLEQEYRSKAP